MSVWIANQESKTKLSLYTNTDDKKQLNQNSFTFTYQDQLFFTEPTEDSCGWQFRDKNGNQYSQQIFEQPEKPSVQFLEHSEEGSATVLISDCTVACGGHFRRAERVWLTLFPGAMFMIDRVETDIPMEMTSRFYINNLDGSTDIHIADDFRLVIRRGGQGVKFFTFPYKETVAMHHLNQDNEDRVLVFDYVTPFSTSHITVYGFAMSDTDGIRLWHLKNTAPGVYRITSPGDQETWKLTLRPEQEPWFIMEKD